MQKTIFILNGPNLNLLGVREPQIYGSETLEDIKKRCIERAARYDLIVDFRQTNFEGVLVETVHEAREKAAAIIINPAGLSFNSIPVLDALKMFDGPKFEVHISNIHQRGAALSPVSRFPHCDRRHCGLRIGRIRPLD